VSHLSESDPTTVEWLRHATARMLGEGGSLAEAQAKAHALLEQVLQQQASVVAFEKVFLIMGVTFFLALPLLLLFRTGRARGGGAAH
jgi:hypothetical protein